MLGPTLGGSRVLTISNQCIDSNDFQDRRLTGSGRYHIANTLAKKRLSQRRRKRNRSLGRIGFVFSDNAIRLFSAIVPDNRHGMAKANLVVVLRLRCHVGCAVPCAPVTKIPRCPRYRRSVAGTLRRSQSFLSVSDLALNLGQSFACHVVQVG